MVNIRLLADLPNALDSAAANTFLYKTAGGMEFQTLEYSDIVGYPTAAIDSAGIISLIDASYLATRDSSNHLDVTSYLDSGISSHVTKDSAGVTVKIGNYSKGISNIYLDSSSTFNIGSYHSFNISNNTITLYGGNSASVFAAAGGSAGGPSRYGDTAVLFGGYNGSAYDTFIDYWDMTTAGNASDFGDLTQARGRGGAVSNGTYGVCIGGWWGDNSNVMDYVTIATPSNATDFGDDVKATYDLGAVSNGTLAVTCAGLNQTAMGYFYIATPGNAASFGTGTNHKAAAYFADNNDRGIIAAGQDGGTTVNTIEYFTIATSGSVSDFGDCTVGRTGPSGCSDDTYGVIASAYNTLGAYTTMDYIVIQTTGNASSFGDCRNHSAYGSGTSNGTYGHFAGGGYNYIDQIVIATPGNATDFGDLTAVKSYTGNTATSGN